MGWRLNNWERRLRKIARQQSELRSDVVRTAAKASPGMRLAVLEGLAGDLDESWADTTRAIDRVDALRLQEES